MNPKVTSKEELIEVGKQIVKEEGIDSLNIRTLSKRCGIASGSVYNYFSSKEGLMISIVESIWDEVFDLGLLSPQKKICLLVEDILNAIETGKKTYPDFISIHHMNFSKEEISSGKNKMLLYFIKLKKILKSSLESSATKLIGNHLDIDDLVDIIFNLVISQFFTVIDKKSIIGMIKTMIVE